MKTKRPFLACKRGSAMIEYSVIASGFGLLALMLSGIAGEEVRALGESVRQALAGAR